MAFIRGDEENQVLFAINLSGEEQKMDLSCFPAAKAMLEEKPTDTIRP